MIKRLYDNMLFMEISLKTETNALRLFPPQNAHFVKMHALGVVKRKTKL